MPRLIAVHEAVARLDDQRYGDRPTPVGRVTIFGTRLPTGAVASGDDLRRTQLLWHIDEKIVAVDDVDDGRISHVIGDIFGSLEIDFVWMPVEDFVPAKHAVPLEADDVQVCSQDAFHERDDGLILQQDESWKKPDVCPEIVFLS